MSTFELKTIENADEKAKPILQSAKDNMGMVPNLFAVMANNPSLLKAYTSADETFRQDSGFYFVEQEVLLLSIALENGCTYCVAAHSFIADNQSNVPKEVTNAIRDGKEIPDAKLQALSQYAKSVVKHRGYPSEEVTKAIKNQGYTDKHIAGVVTAVGMKTFSNYINHIANTPLDQMFESRKWNK
ncbi:carboxymuconolactone decarboxylase family protein [Flavobacterium sp. CS20]|uniref:carboxymuconolactone decarboxylase family protein n=1 Tax=Flavobacterium sp. CS20 TaxID=2775246 RepID=UPI001B39F09C|nr:carboxymuconolactone decarboxylase family protein [Flavobacterium sp. CS20]QTY27236.1 carboxymuconolactone decarboxylase family protein [Flavobacterium sp. CS20]